MIFKRKKLERQVQEAIQDYLEYFEKTVFEGRVFSRIQKYLKAIRKTPAIQPVVKFVDKESSCGEEQFNMFNDYFISVFNAQLLQSNEIAFPRRILNQLKATPEIVSNHLKSLGENKAMGPDKIGNLILKNCSHTLCQSLATLFQTCLNKGKYPTIWKTCQVTLIFKDGNKADVKRYRPISLLCCCSEVFEKIIFDALYKTERSSTWI